MKQHRWDDRRKMYFSQFKMIGSSRPRCWPLHFWVRAPFLACKWLPSRCVFTKTLLGAWAIHVSLSNLISSPTLKTPSWSPHLTFIACLLSLHPGGVTLRAGASISDFGEGHIYSIHNRVIIAIKKEHIIDTDNLDESLGWIMNFIILNERS